MRFLVAAVLFGLSTILMLTGLAQRTILAPPAQYSLSIEPESAAPYAIVPNDVLALHTGAIKVTVDGSPQAFIAAARESDIRAFVSESPHVGLVALAKEDTAVALSLIHI